LINGAKSDCFSTEIDNQISAKIRTRHAETDLFVGMNFVVHLTPDCER
jgi:hypothetical protein